jgi:hypothetical protein
MEVDGSPTFSGQASAASDKCLLARKLYALTGCADAPSERLYGDGMVLVPLARICSFVRLFSCSAVYRFSVLGLGSAF